MCTASALVISVASLRLTGGSKRWVSPAVWKLLAVANCGAAIYSSELLMLLHCTESRTSTIPLASGLVFLNLGVCPESASASKAHPACLHEERYPLSNDILEHRFDDRKLKEMDDNDGSQTLIVRSLLSSNTPEDTLITSTSWSTSTSRQHHSAEVT